MLTFIKRHPYIVGGIISFVILLIVGVYGVGASWEESLFGSAVIAVVAVLGIWWKWEVWP